MPPNACQFQKVPFVARRDEISTTGDRGRNDVIVIRIVKNYPRHLDWLHDECNAADVIRYRLGPEVGPDHSGGELPSRENSLEFGE